MNTKKLSIIGDIINNAYARARNAFAARDLKGYQQLAKSQTELGVDFIDVNIDGTQQIQVRPEEMLAFLPDLIPALQEATPLPLCIDNPSVEYQKVALRNYNRSLSGTPILNSISASRERLDEMIELVKEYDTLVIVMASERFTPDGSAQCMVPEEVHSTAKHFIELLMTKAERRIDQIIIDPGLAPVGADTYGLVNIGLDAMRLIRNDPELRGIHLTVGLSNFAWGTPKQIRHNLERAYMTIAVESGLDYVIANPEKTPLPFAPDDKIVGLLRHALDEGRAVEGETREMAGFRQADAVMKIWSEEETGVS